MTPQDDEALQRLAKAVADRAPVDWEAEAAANAALRPQLRRLRILEAVASLQPDAAPDPMIGRTLLHYRIEERIGAGGMGVVYRAHDQGLRRPVALKVLPPDLVSSHERRQRFLREARTAAALTHPSIAVVHEVGEDQGVLFISMELVEGKTLRELIGGRPLPIKEALSIATEMAEGLEHAHRLRVIHRDLKPNNVMVRPDQHVKLLDFGLAKLLAEHPDAATSVRSKLETISVEVTRVGQVLGTPAYMSPEQIRGQPLDVRSDIFAFGATLYEMVTGKPPFQGKAPADMVSAILRDEPVPPSSLNPEVPPDLEEIIRKCLKKEAGERYQDTRNLVEDLLRIQRVRETSPEVSPTRGRGRIARRVRLQPALVFGMTVLLLAAGAATWRWLRAPVGFQSGDSVIVADIDNATGQPELDTAVRDAFEELLGRSSLLRVIRGKELEEFLRLRARSPVSGINVSLAEQLCAEQRCAGYVLGRIGQERSGYRIEVALYRTNRRRAALRGAATASTREEILQVLHDLALALRRDLGETQSSISKTLPPTTRSLAAFQAFAVAERWPLYREAVRLYDEAIAFDPGFVEAYASLANAHSAYGNWKDYRRAAERALALSSPLPDPVKLWNEIMFLEASYDFDVEEQRLKAYQRRYPLELSPVNYLAAYYLFITEDPVKGEASARAALRLAPALPPHLYFLSVSLGWLGRADEIESIISDYRARGGPEYQATAALTWVHAVRLQWPELRETMQRLPQAPEPWLRAWGYHAWTMALLAAGRLREAEPAALDAFRASRDPDVNFIWFQSANALRHAWLHQRRMGETAALPPEYLELVGNNMLYVPDLVAFSVEAGMSDPLAKVIRQHEESGNASAPRFVKEELEFARGGLSLIGGRPGEARRILEPLSRSSHLVRRHRVLGRAYEATDLWREAAVEYEAALRNPSQKWGQLENPALVVLDQYRLARCLERLGETAPARRWYEKFLADWKDADPDIPELVEAKRRLAALAQGGSGA